MNKLIGSLFKNTLTDQDEGVLVNSLDNKNYFFKLEDNEIPVFNTLDNNSNLAKIGNINDDSNSKLKNQLLKYYRTNNLENDEIKLLTPVMDHAFYNGIPEYKTTEQPDIKDVDLKSFMCDSKNGECIYIHAGSNSPYSFLNNKKHYVIDKIEDGVWVTDVDKNKFTLLFYKDKDVPTFSGISRIDPIENKTLDSNEYDRIYKNFLDNNKCSSMICDGNRVKIDPNSKEVILPLNKNKIYSIENDRFVDKEIDAEIDKITEINNNNLEEVDLDFTKQCSVLKGGGGKDNTKKELEEEKEYKSELLKSKKKSLFQSFQESDKGKLEEETIKKSKKSSKKSKKEKEYDLEDYDEVLDFEEDDIEILEVIETNVIQEKDEKDKLYNENLQVSEINKIFTNEYPIQLRTNDIVIQSIKKKVASFIKLKNNIVKLNENKNRYNITPFMLDYVLGNYKNDFLIPLVINKKKIYTTKDDDDISERYSEIVNFYQELNSINYLIDFKKNNKDVKYDFKMVTEQLQELCNPYINNIKIEDKELNIYNIQLGKEKENILEQSNIIDKNNFINFNNFERFKINNSTKNLDVLSFRYCRKPFNCKTFNSTKVPSDYLVSLGSDYKFNKEVSDIKRINELVVYEKMDYTLGEKINIVGFIRIPISLVYTVHNDKLYKNKIINKYQYYLDNIDNDIDVVNLSKAKQNNFFKKPNECVMYIFDKHKEYTLFDYLNHLLPSFEDIMDYHKEDFKKNNSNSNLIDTIIEIYGYHKNELNIAQTKLIQKYYDMFYDKNISIIEKINSLEKKINSKNILDINTYEINIDDYLIEEIQKMTGLKYIQFNTKTDNDTLRFNWIKINKNMILFMFYTEIISSYNNQNIDFEKKVIEKQIDDLNNEILEVKKNKFSNSDCFNKIKFVKYKNKEELHKTNNIQTYDENNQLININDIAIIENENKKEYYKRMLLNDLEHWVLDDETNVRKMIESDDDICDSIYSDLFTFNLEKPSCSLNEESLKCENFNKKINNTIIERIEHKKEHLKRQKETLDEINKNRKLYENKLDEIKKNLRNEKKTNSNLLKYKLEEGNKLLKQIENFKSSTSNCVHFNMINYISKIQNKTIEETYKYYQLIFNNYLNTDNLIDINTVTDENNYTSCNICNQDLLCKHHLYGVKKLEMDGDIDLENLINIYGVESNGLYICKICGETIASTEVQEIFENIGNTDILKEEDEEEDKVNLLDNYLKTLEQNEDIDKSDIQYKIELFYQLKEILNIKLKKDDEKDILLFIKTHNFIKKESLYAKLKQMRPDFPNKVINTMTLAKYYRFVCSDIASMFLITLQTSKHIYKIKSKFCGSDYIGYPLLEDITHNHGIELIMCLFKVLASRTKYKYLEKNIEKDFIDRLNNIIKNDNFIINKILIGRNHNHKRILNVRNFETYIHSKWNSFKPDMSGYKKIINKPERKPYEKDLKDLNSKNYNKLLDSCNSYISYNSNVIFYLINKIVKDEIVLNKFFKTTLVTNSCCLDTMPNNNYINYFEKIDKDIKQRLNDNINIAELKKMIEFKNKKYIHKLNTKNIHKPTLSITQNFILNDKDISEYFKKYIFEGEHIGKEYKFNQYNICILTGKIKDKVVEESNRYSIFDFKKLHDSVNKLNVLTVDKQKKLEVIESKYIDLSNIYNYKNKSNILLVYEYLIYKLSDNRKLSIIKDTLVAIKKNIDIKKDYNNYEKWSVIINLMRGDINSILKVITNNKKSFETMKKDLNNLNSFDNLYKEKKEKTNTEHANEFKLLKSIENHKKNFNYLYQSVLLIKNKKIYNSKNVENIRSQYQYLFPFKNEIKLFTKMAKILEIYKDIFINLNVQKNKYLSLENCNVIFHYLLIHSMLMILQDDKMNLKKTVKKSKNTKKSKKKPEEDDDKFINKSNYKSNFYNRIKFLYLFIINITKSQKEYDKLTIDFINETRNNIEQKQQRKNLKIFQLLKTNEGMDEFRTLIHQKMNLGQIKYSELEKEYSELGLNQDDLYQSNTVEDDNMDDRKFYNVQTDELDENFNDGNMVFDAEEDDIEDAEFIL